MRAVEPESGAGVSRREARAGAFTLLELILVLTLVSIILSVVTASLRGFHAERTVDDAAAHFLALAKQGRTRAVDSASLLQLHVDPEDGAYWVATTAVGEADEADAEIRAEWGRVFRLPAGVSMRRADTPDLTGPHAIDFAPDGSVQPFSFVFTGNGDRSRAVTCLGAGGTFSLIEVKGDEDAQARFDAIPSP